jgi:multidrug resistance protein
MTDRKSTLWLIFLTIFISMAGFGIVIPVLPVYAKDEPFKLTPHEIGWLVGIFSLVQLFSSPLIGKISDRIGRKPVLLFSLIGTAIGFFITGAAQAGWMLFLGRIIDGASGGNISTAQACIADVTPAEERSKAMGLIGAAFGLGFVCGPALGGLLAQISHSAPFYFAGALSILNACLVSAKLPETLPPDHREQNRVAVPLGEVFAEGRGMFIALLLLAYLAAIAGFSIMTTLFALFCEDRFGYDVKHTAFIFAYVGVIGVIVQGGLLRRLLKRPIEKQLAFVGAAILAVSFWLLPMSHSLGIFLVVCGAIALGNGLITPTLNGLASRHVHGRMQGRVLGLMQSAGSLGRFLGPIIAVLWLPSNFSELARPLANDLLAQVDRGYGAAFLVSAFVMIVSALIILGMKPREISSPN